MEGLNEDPSIQLQLVMVCGNIDRPFGSGVNFVCDCNIMNMKCPSHYIYGTLFLPTICLNYKFA